MTDSWITEAETWKCWIIYQLHRRGETFGCPILPTSNSPRGYPGAVMKHAACSEATRTDDGFYWTVKKQKHRRPTRSCHSSKTMAPTGTPRRLCCVVESGVWQNQNLLTATNLCFTWFWPFFGARRLIRWQSGFFFIITLNVARDGCIEQLWRMDSFPGVRFVLKLLRIMLLSTGKWRWWLE